ncbi:hypothetical protein [Hyella patelloides]|uniref:hypothetical protein n=1 Tax=Hyella patelloides TaxID=1982969 RepID=UPI0011A0C2F3|nr:hypothetical protein [Hyella patelloides]
MNHQGECSKPSWSEVKNLDSTNKPYMLVPDNNVCIHVSDFNISKKQDKTKRIKARNFKNYVFQSNITVNPTWGLLERASKPGTLNLNIEKLNDFEDAFWRQMNHYTGNQTISSISKSIDVLKFVLYPLYAYLLKIKLILLERGDSSKKNAETSLNELYDFIEEMKIYLLIPWQFAVAIFGGHNQLNKFIKPRKGQDIFQAIWGAAWDLFYLQTIHEYNGTRKIKETYPQYIFATDDERCATIGKTLKVIAAIHYGDVTYNQTLISYDFPHWRQKDSFLLEMSQEINKGILKRIVRRNNLSEKDFQLELNTIINNSSQQISELTQEIKAVAKKGFG